MQRYEKIPTYRPLPPQKTALFSTPDVSNLPPPRKPFSANALSSSNPASSSVRYSIVALHHNGKRCCKYPATIQD